MWKKLLCTAIVAHASFGVWAASGTYPNKPIRLLDGYPPGGGTDFVARVSGAKMAETFGQTVIVDNRPGAAGNLAAEITARANPDGYTLLLGVSTGLASSPSLYRKLGYDLLKDFSYVSLVASGTYILVTHPALPAKSVSELVALARSKPKAIRYGSGGVGSPIHLAMELLQSLTQIELLHVPYKGAAPAVVAATGGEVELAFSSIAAALPMVKAQRLNALAVTSAKRLGSLPDVPTVAETGIPAFDVTPYYGVLAPAGTPAAVVKLLNSEIRRVVQLDDVKAKLAVLGLEATASTPAEFKELMKAEMTKWARVVKDARVTPN